jgi:hypothetical protein
VFWFAPDPALAKDWFVHQGFRVAGQHICVVNTVITMAPTPVTTTFVTLVAPKKASAESAAGTSADGKSELMAIDEVKSDLEHKLQEALKVPEEGLC